MHVIRYGGLAVAAQRSVKSMAELVEVSPADGVVGGLAEVWGHPVVLAAYDYTVFAGTQGAMNHKKQDRLFSLAASRSLPVVLFAEGGGGGCVGGAGGYCNGPQEHRLARAASGHVVP